MKKEPIKTITVDKAENKTKLCVRVELHGQHPGDRKTPEVLRKKVRTVDIHAYLDNIGEEYGACTSDPGTINNSQGPVTGCWQFELPTKPKTAPKTTTNKRKTKTA
jgi:hypothetical protein